MKFCQYNKISIYAPACKRLISYALQISKSGRILSIIYSFPVLYKNFGPSLHSDIGSQHLLIKKTHLRFINSSVIESEKGNIIKFCFKRNKTTNSLLCERHTV